MTEDDHRLDNHELRERSYSHFPDIYFVSIGFTQSTVLGAIVAAINQIINNQWPTDLGSFVNFLFHLLSTFGVCVGVVIVVSEYSRFIVLFRRVIEVRDITYPLAIGLSQYLAAVNIDDPHDVWWAWMALFSFIGTLTLYSSLKHCKIDHFQKGSEWVYTETRVSIIRSMLLHAVMSLVFFTVWVLLHVVYLPLWEIAAIKLAAYGTLLYLAILVLIDSTCFIPRMLRIWDERGAPRPAARTTRRNRQQRTGPARSSAK